MNVLKKNNEINYLVTSSSVGNYLFNNIMYLLFERILLPVLNFVWLSAYGVGNFGIRHCLKLMF